MLNHIIIMGRLTRDPEFRQTQNGVSSVSATIACDRDYVPAGSERETDFFDVIAFRKTAEFIHDHFSKGRMIVVSGRLQIREWTDKNGAKRRNAEITAERAYFGEGKRDQAQGFANLPDDTEVPF